MNRFFSSLVFLTVFLTIFSCNLFFAYTGNTSENNQVDNCLVGNWKMSNDNFDSYMSKIADFFGNKYHKSTGQLHFNVQANGDTSITVDNLIAHFSSIAMSPINPSTPFTDVLNTANGILTGKIGSNQTNDIFKIVDVKNNIKIHTITKVADDVQEEDSSFNAEEEGEFKYSCSNNLLVITNDESEIAFERQ